MEIGHSAEDPPQRGGAQPVRDGADLRGRQSLERPEPAGDEPDEQHCAQTRFRRAAARETFRRGQRLGQALQLVAWHRHGPAADGAGPRCCRKPAVPHLLRECPDGCPAAQRRAEGLHCQRHQRPSPRRP